MFQKIPTGCLFEDSLGMFQKIPTGNVLEDPLGKVLKHPLENVLEDTQTSGSSKTYTEHSHRFFVEGGYPPSVFKKRFTGEWEGEGVCTGERGGGLTETQP